MLSCEKFNRVVGERNGNKMGEECSSGEATVDILGMRASPSLRARIE